MSLKPTLTLAEVATNLHCKPDKVSGFIASGELSAINVATKGSKKPRWIIETEALEQFKRARTTRPQPTPTRRRQTLPEVESRY